LGIAFLPCANGGREERDPKANRAHERKQRGKKGQLFFRVKKKDVPLLKALRVSKKRKGREIELIGREEGWTFAPIS